MYGHEIATQGLKTWPWFTVKLENREHRKYFWNVVLKEKNQLGVRN